MQAIRNATLLEDVLRQTHPIDTLTREQRQAISIQFPSPLKVSSHVGFVNRNMQISQFDRRQCTKNATIEFINDVSATAPRREFLSVAESLSPAMP